MPFTPYHFGPSGFVGLVFRKWIDIPVFVLANVVVDIEVLVIMLLGIGKSVHRYCHTLLIGAVVGVIWAVAAYPLRHFFKKIMQIFRVRYETSFCKMLISGILGVWFHVLIDSLCWGDVRPFWPLDANPLLNLVTVRTVRLVCIILFVPAIFLYVIAAVSYARKNNVKKVNPK